ncbi:unnamed protein product [Amoebophrya sp. A25]|nr:unnamed protein product [Amoebophrya sp. A25]|eukprot:GSA25T00003199001.1
MPWFRTGNSNSRRPTLIYYRSLGDGPTRVLFVQGMGVPQAGWCGTVEGMLASGSGSGSEPSPFTICTPDNRGVGFSIDQSMGPKLEGSTSRPGGLSTTEALKREWTTWRVENLARDFLDLIIHGLKWKEFHIVGISFGGMLSQHMAYVLALDKEKAEQRMSMASSKMTNSTTASSSPLPEYPGAKILSMSLLNTLAEVHHFYTMRGLGLQVYDMFMHAPSTAPSPVPGGARQSTSKKVGSPSRKIVSSGERVRGTSKNGGSRVSTARTASSDDAGRIPTNEVQAAPPSGQELQEARTLPTDASRLSTYELQPQVAQPVEQKLEHQRDHVHQQGRLSTNELRRGAHHNEGAPVHLPPLHWTKERTAFHAWFIHLYGPEYLKFVPEFSLAEVEAAGKQMTVFARLHSALCAYVNKHQEELGGDSEYFRNKKVKWYMGLILYAHNASRILDVDEEVYEVLGKTRTKNLQFTDTRSAGKNHGKKMNTRSTSTSTSPPVRVVLFPQGQHEREPQGQHQDEDEDKIANDLLSFIRGNLEKMLAKHLQPNATRPFAVPLSTPVSVFSQCKAAFYAHMIPEKLALARTAVAGKIVLVSADRDKVLRAEESVKLAKWIDADVLVQVPGGHLVFDQHKALIESTIRETILASCSNATGGAGSCGSSSADVPSASSCNCSSGTRSGTVDQEQGALASCNGTSSGSSPSSDPPTSPTAASDSLPLPPAALETSANAPTYCAAPSTSTAPSTMSTSSAATTSAGTWFTIDVNRDCTNKEPFDFWLRRILQDEATASMTNEKGIPTPQMIIERQWPGRPSRKSVYLRCARPAEVPDPFNLFDVPVMRIQVATRGAFTRNMLAEDVVAVQSRL